MELNHRFLHVAQVSLPLSYEVAFVSSQTSQAMTEVGVEPTESRGSRPRRFSILRTRPLGIAGPGVAPGRQGL
jgi:hypothetical protein